MTLPAPLVPIDKRITAWMARHGVGFARIALGIVFLWFGAIKFVPGLSPAADLAGRTIEAVTFGTITPSVGVPILAAWECLVGLGLLTGKLLRVTLLLLFVQMPGTMMPLLLFPEETFRIFPRSNEGLFVIE